MYGPTSYAYVRFDTLKLLQLQLTKMYKLHENIPLCLRSCFLFNYNLILFNKKMLMYIRDTYILYSRHHHHHQHHYYFIIISTSRLILYSVYNSKVAFNLKKI